MTFHNHLNLKSYTLIGKYNCILAKCRQQQTFAFATSNCSLWKVRHSFEIIGMTSIIMWAMYKNCVVAETLTNPLRLDPLDLCCEGKWVRGLMFYTLFQMFHKMTSNALSVLASPCTSKSGGPRGFELCAIVFLSGQISWSNKIRCTSILGNFSMVKGQLLLEMCIMLVYVLSSGR